jgi:hypothetical protein
MISIQGGCGLPAVNWLLCEPRHEQLVMLCDQHENKSQNDFHGSMI